MQVSGGSPLPPEKSAVGLYRLGQCGEQQLVCVLHSVAVSVYVCVLSDLQRKPCKGGHGSAFAVFSVHCCFAAAGKRGLVV